MNKSFNQLAHFKQNQTYTLSHYKKNKNLLESFPRTTRQPWLVFVFI